MRTMKLPSYKSDRGFTLIEVMISMALGMVVLAGVFTMFGAQSTVYKTQDERVIATQDSEFLVTFISDDLRRALVSPAGSANALATQVGVTDVAFPAPVNATNTTDILFDIWVENNVGTYAAVDANVLRAQRHYRLVRSGVLGCLPTDVQYVGIDFCLRYDRENASADSTGFATTEILEGVTMFRVFRDDAANAAAMAVRALYQGIPAPLPLLNTGGQGGVAREITKFTLNSVNTQVHDSPLGAGSAEFINGYTILLETAHKAATKGQTIYNALGVDVSAFENPPRKRTIRYVQVYPRSMVP